MLEGAKMIDTASKTKDKDRKLRHIRISPDN